jgi:chromosome segregation ATPase
MESHNRTMMDGMWVILFTSIGTVLGTAIVGLMRQRSSRSTATDEELKKLQQRLQKSDEALAETKASLDAMREQSSKYERSADENREDLRMRNQQLRLAAEEVREQTTRRTAAEQEAQALREQLTALRERLSQPAVTGDEQTDSGVRESTVAVSTLKEESEGEKRLAPQLAEQITRPPEELPEPKGAVEEVTHDRVTLEQLADEREWIKEIEESRSFVSSLKEELERERRLSHEFAERITHLAAELVEQKKTTEEATRQLVAARERIQNLTDEIGGMRASYSDLEARLQVEIQSAVRREELLTTARRRVSLFFDELGAQLSNDNHVASVHEDAQCSAVPSRDEAANGDAVVHIVRLPEHTPPSDGKV